MSTGDNQEPDIVGIATSGIQDVSALLPLLGTEQCEYLVTSALHHGLLYAAATPMSIFGSLGIVKAGFITLWGSIDKPFFRGPTLLRNAGVVPSGIGELLVPVATGNRRLYVAEDRLRRHLSRIRIRSVKVNLLSKDLWLWNLRLVGVTVLLSGLGLLPYVYLIDKFLSDDPFRTTWLYPVIRVIGCSIISLSIQATFQLRVLEEAYSRIRFSATDTYMKDCGKSIPAFYSSNERSKSVFKTLLHYHNSIDRGAPPSMGMEGVIDAETRGRILQDIGTMASFSFPAYEEKSTSPPAPGDLHQLPYPKAPGVGRAGRDPEPGNSLERKSSWSSLCPFFSLSLPSVATLVLGISRISLAFGLGLAMVGYIGCFSVVQASPREGSKGPLVWLACEAALAILRTLAWAWNPSWDDPPSPIVLEKLTDVDANTPSKKGSSYGVGWMLDSLTANDMHALIIGADPPGERGDQSKSMASAEAIVSYLQDVLLVPRGQVVSLTGAGATKERIVEELKSLAQRGSVADDAPILIYLAMPSLVNVATERAYLVPHLREGIDWERVRSDDFLLRRYSIPYDDIVDILGNIANDKTDNIVSDPSLNPVVASLTSIIYARPSYMTPPILIH